MEKKLIDICSVCGDSFDCNNTSCKCIHYFNIMNRYFKDKDRKKLDSIFSLDNYSEFYKDYPNKDFDILKEAYTITEELYHRKDNQEIFEIREYYHKIYKLFVCNRHLIKKFSNQKFINKCINENLKIKNNELEELGILFE